MVDMAKGLTYKSLHRRSAPKGFSLSTVIVVLHTVMPFFRVTSVPTFPWKEGSGRRKESNYVETRMQKSCLLGFIYFLL